MGNRIYIAAGLLAIVLLLAAFIVPRFWPWDSYKPNLEAMASEALGLDVDILGTLDFTLLPQPRLIVGAVSLSGPNGAVGSAQVIEADFSLTDFLRDRFTVTRLRVVEPEIALAVDPQGQLALPVSLAQEVSASNVSIVDAEIVGGRVSLYDQRSEQVLAADDLTGVMQIDALRGPFSFEGTLDYDGLNYALEVATTTLNAQGEVRVNASLRPAQGGETSRPRYGVDGVLTTGGYPSFSGNFSFRQPAAPVPDDEEGDDEGGDLVFQSRVEAGLERVLFSDFTLLPDEDQIATRLTGSGEVVLGASPRFVLQVNGGVVTLLPPDLARDASEGPFELVTLLESLPTPPVPPLPGEISLSITELGLRSIRLRDVRLAARAEGEEWAIESVSAALAGDTRLSLSGTLGQVPGEPMFSGQMVLDSQALDGLAGLWERRPEGNPLFGQSGRLEADVRLAVDRVEVRNGILTLDGADHGVELVARLGEDRSLSLGAELGTLSPRASAALLALLPTRNAGNAFQSSFPTGSFAISADSALLLEQTLSDVSASGAWSAGQVTLDSLDIGDFGGLSLSGSGRLAGTLTAPSVTFSGEAALAEDAPILALAGNGPDDVLPALISRNLPASVAVTLDAPLEAGAQSMVVSGTAGALDIDLGADLDQGIASLAVAPLQFDLTAAADSAEPIFEQLGMTPLFAGSEGALLTLSGRGNTIRALDAELSVEGGGERVDYTGSLLLGETGTVRGQGRVSVFLADTAPLMAMAGAPGITVPAIEAEAEMGFLSSESVTLSGVEGWAGASAIAGDLTYSSQAGGALLSGELALDTLELETLVSVSTGPEAISWQGDTIWPDGAIALAPATRATRGRIQVTTPEITLDAQPLLVDAGFEIGWDPQEVRVRALQAGLGGGRLALEATLCCAADIAARSLSALATLENVDMTAVLPQGSANALGGSLSASARVQGNGNSLSALFGSLTGEGSFAVAGLDIARLSPDAFASAAETENLVEVAPEDLEVQVVTALDSGPFRAGDVSGGLSFAGGGLRISNLAIEGDDARLLGGLTLDLETLGLSGNWTLANTADLGGNGLITETTGRIGLALAGTILEPLRELDLAQMVDAIQLRALEIELDELERLRAEDDARRTEAAAEQARLLEQEAQRQAEELLGSEEEVPAPDIGSNPPDLDAGEEEPGSPEPAGAQGEGEAPPAFAPGLLDLPFQADPLAPPAP